MAESLTHNSPLNQQIKHYVDQFALVIQSDFLSNLEVIKREKVGSLLQPGLFNAHVFGPEGPQHFKRGKSWGWGWKIFSSFALISNN